MIVSDSALLLDSAHNEWLDMIIGGGVAASIIVLGIGIALAVWVERRARVRASYNAIRLMFGAL